MMSINCPIKGSILYKWGIISSGKNFSDAELQRGNILKIFALPAQVLLYKVIIFTCP